MCRVTANGNRCAGDGAELFRPKRAILEALARFPGIRRGPRALEACMTFPAVAILACVGVLAFLLSYRAPAGKPGALNRLALLHGVRPLWGETEESLRNRTTRASRWPYSRQAP